MDARGLRREGDPLGEYPGMHSERVPHESRSSRRNSLRDLVAEVRSLLNWHDPVYLIAIGAPEDEYDPEVRTILPRLGEASDAEGVQRVLHEEFTRWFGGVSMFTYEEFAPVAVEVWAAWLRFQQSSNARGAS
jgi:hypothetical protein